MQVVLESSATAAEYDSAPAGTGGDVIGRDMAFDLSRDHVYVITSTQVYLIHCFARNRESRALAHEMYNPSPGASPGQKMWGGHTGRALTASL